MPVALASPAPHRGYRRPTPPAPEVDAPTRPVRTRPSWLVAGAALLAAAVVLLLWSPHWYASDERGVIAHLSVLVALVVIGVALLVTGRRPSRRLGR